MKWVLLSIFHQINSNLTLKNSTFKLLEKTVKIHFEALAFHNTFKLHK